MSKVKFIMDNEQVYANEGETILEVANRMGKNIPTLCNDPRLEPFTSCFLCLVEVEGKNTYVPSCATKVTPCMNVKTTSPQIRAARKLALELLMSTHFADCISPCRLACPANIDIQTYIAHIALKDYSAALKTIMQNNPFPGTCGRICPHQCELQCRRNKVDEPVGINPLKRFLADMHEKKFPCYKPELPASTGKKVAIVGAGPAGLTAAYYLRQKGHAVTIFEMNPQPGGILCYGIPSYRLPKDVLTREIQRITDLGVDVKYNQKMGRDFSLSDLKNKYGFDAIFVCIGAWTSMSMRVKGENAQGVLAGIDFLYRVAKGEKIELGQKLVVIGGGNTAIDAARTGVRLKSKVTILYRRTRKEMPAETYEVDEAEREGVEMIFLAAPVELVLENGRVKRVRAIRMKLGEIDSSGRPRPVPIKGSEFEFEVNTVIAAIGQRPDPSCWHTVDGPGIGRANRIEADDKTYQTKIPWVFAGGDCLTGPATAVEAIACGHKAALSIDRYIQGQKLVPHNKLFSSSIGKLEYIDESMYADKKRKARVKTHQLSLQKRLDNFQEVEMGLSETDALGEADRCLECGCTKSASCKLRSYCEEYNVVQDRFKPRFQHQPLVEDHPFIVFDPNKCIICGRCVRICAEVQGVSALGFVQRGFDTKIQPEMGKPLLATDCDACGQCINTCPTAALDMKQFVPKNITYEAKSTPIVCGFCGIGCRLTLESTNRHYIKVKTDPGSFHNRGNLCVDGSFAHRWLETLPRLTKPKVKDGDNIKKASWEQAIALAGSGLKQGIAQNAGLTVLVNGPLTNEDAYILARLTRTCFGTNRILALDGPKDPLIIEHSLHPSRPKVQLEEFKKADLIWVLGDDPFEYAPIVGIELRSAALAGVPLIMMGARSSRLDKLAKQIFRIAKSNQVILFNLLTKFVEFKNKDVLYEACYKIRIKPQILIATLTQLKKAKHPIIIFNDAIDSQTARALGDLLRAIGHVGQGIMLRRGGNSLGRDLMGLHPGLLPGGLDISVPMHCEHVARIWGIDHVNTQPGLNQRQTYSALKAGETKALIIVNTDPYGFLLSANDIHPNIFTIVFDLRPSEFGKCADVLFPVPSLTESSGTIISFDGRVMPTESVCKPAGTLTLFEILSRLAISLGHALPFDSPEKIWLEMNELMPVLNGLGNTKLELAGKMWPNYTLG